MGELTRNESLIAYLVMTGISNAEIGDRIGYHRRYIGRLLTIIFRKTGARNRTELAVMAWEAMG